MILSHTLNINNYVSLYGHIVKIVQLHSENADIVYSDGTRLLIAYQDLVAIIAESNTLLKFQEISKISSKEYPLHTKEILSIDILGKKYYIHLLDHEDGVICRFDSFISFHYLHELQNICTLINPLFSLIIPPHHP